MTLRRSQVVKIDTGMKSPGLEIVRNDTGLDLSGARGLEVWRIVSDVKRFSG